MSLIRPTSKKFILIFCLLCLATEVWAVRAKIRFLFPVSMESVTDGFENTKINTSEFVLSFVMPVSRNTQLDFGYSYFNARIEDPDTSSEAYSGVFRAHLLEIGAGYTGIELTRTISMLIEASTRFPVSGQAEVNGTPGFPLLPTISLHKSNPATFFTTRPPLKILLPSERKNRTPINQSRIVPKP